MSFSMNYGQDETFRLLTDYFSGRRNKILSSIAPSYLRAEVGSWVSMTRGNAIGEVEANIAKRNGGSYIHFNFDFRKEHIGNFLMSAIGAVVLYFVVIWMTNTMFAGEPSHVVSKGLEIMNPIVISLCVFLIALVMLLSGSNVSKTKRRFLEEFKTFTQTLGIQPPPPPSSPQQ